jgi:hypothetical protein
VLLRAAEALPRPEVTLLTKLEMPWERGRNFGAKGQESKGSTGLLGAPAAARRGRPPARGGAPPPVLWPAAHTPGSLAEARSTRRRYKASGRGFKMGWLGA